MTQPLDFRLVEGPAAQEIIDIAAPLIEPAIYPEGKTSVRVAPLPFYGDVSFYGITDTTLPEPNTRYIYHLRGNVLAHDWTNEVIYRLNEILPILLNEDTITPYVRFFFHYVRGQMGRFLFVETCDDIAWLPEAPAGEKAEAASRLKPLSYRGIGPDGMHTLVGTVIFRDALFQTKIKVASEELDADDPDTGISEHYTVGQMMLTGEELLMEELHVAIPPEPGEFG